MIFARDAMNVRYAGWSGLSLNLLPLPSLKRSENLLERRVSKVPPKADVTSERILTRSHEPGFRSRWKASGIPTRCVWKYHQRISSRLNKVCYSAARFTQSRSNHIGIGHITPSSPIRHVDCNCNKFSAHHIDDVRIVAMFGIGRYFYFETRGIVSEPAGMAMGGFDRFLFRYVASAFMNVDDVGMMDAARFCIIERNDARSDHFGSATCVGNL
jgi:hypothetical protein